MCWSVVVAEMREKEEYTEAGIGVQRKVKHMHDGTQKQR